MRQNPERPDKADKLNIKERDWDVLICIIYDTVSLNFDLTNEIPIFNSRIGSYHA